jgi:hypothetical protein
METVMEFWVRKTAGNFVDCISCFEFLKVSGSWDDLRMYLVRREE